jgi:RNA-splicing ligase RtcB
MREIINNNGVVTKIFAYTIEEAAIEQIINVANLYDDCKIRIMPDCHAAKGCTIGTTIKLKDKVTPNLVGVDIGCGMLVVELGNIDIDFNRLDEVINNFVPSGFSVHDKAINNFDCTKFICNSVLDNDFCDKSIGSLGGGNHFIEIDADENENKYLIIHSGSRNLGVKVCKFYQDLAIETLSSNKDEISNIIAKMKSEGHEHEISKVLSKLPKKKIDKELAYLSGENMNKYIHDMDMAQDFATCNRLTIANIILERMNFKIIDWWQTIHNYIDTDNMILRKGAVSAQKGERLIIPMNMRDGSLICTGKGNPDWNYSAPHGAGRLMSRTKAHKTLSENEFENEMKGVYSTSVCESTIDESPMAYKPMQEILDCISDTVKVEKTIKPVYNFKAK